MKIEYSMQMIKNAASERETIQCTVSFYHSMAS